MKRVGLVLLILLGMTVSFVAIGLIMLFATGAVENMDEVRLLLTGRVAGSDSSLVAASEIVRAQRALRQLQQQKHDLQAEILRLEQARDHLQQIRDALIDEVDALNRRAGRTAGGPTGAQPRKKMVEIFNTMDVVQAAAIMDRVSDETVLWLLPQLETRQAAKILASLSDEDRKARIAELLVGKSAPSTAAP